MRETRYLNEVHNSIKIGGGIQKTPDDIDAITSLFLEYNVNDVGVFSALNGITNKLETASTETDESKKEEIIKDIKNQCKKTYPNLSKSFIDDVVDKEISSAEKSREIGIDALKDAYMGSGEPINSVLISEELRRKANKMGKSIPINNYDSRKIVITDNNFQGANVLKKTYRNIKKLEPKLQGVSIFPGYVGSTEQGTPTTLGRNTSDVSLIIYASSFKNFGCAVLLKDQEGLLAIDPRLFDKYKSEHKIKPKLIRTIDYKGFGELAWTGSSVVAASTFERAELTGLPVDVINLESYIKAIEQFRNIPREKIKLEDYLNSLKESTKGTYLFKEGEIPNETITGIAYAKNVCSFDIENFGLNKRIGIATRILNVFKKENISIDFLGGGVTDLSVIIKKKDKKNEEDIDEIDADKIIKRLDRLVGKGSTKYRNNMGAIVVVGNRNYFDDVGKTLISNGIDKEFISLGLAKRSIVYAVKRDDTERAAELIYDSYIKHKK